MELIGINLEKSIKFIWMRFFPHFFPMDPRLDYFKRALKSFSLVKVWAVRRLFDAWHSEKSENYIARWMCF